jgi:4-oxalocrotonate tautomerase
MIRNVTDAMVAVEGEGMRGVTWVRLKEFRNRQWGIGGNTPSAEDLKAMAAR